MAEKRTGGRLNVYSGVLQLPASLLRTLAREAGVHIYCDTDDVTTAGNGLVGIHASSDGTKTSNLPREHSVTNALTGESLGKSESFKFEMKMGDTRLLRMR